MFKFYFTLSILEVENKRFVLHFGISFKYYIKITAKFTGFHEFMIIFEIQNSN